MVILDALEQINNFLPEAPTTESGFSDFMTSIGNGISNSIGNLVGSLKDGLTGIYSFGKSIGYLSESISYLANHHGLPIDDGFNVVVLDNYIGNIRFISGDIVFLQLYCFLIVGAAFTMFMLFLKLIKVLRYLFSVLSNIPFFQTFFLVIKRKFGFIFS